MTKSYLLIASLFLSYTCFANEEKDLHSRVFKNRSARIIPVSIIFDGIEVGEVQTKFSGNKVVSVRDVNEALAELVSDPKRIPTGEVTLSELQKLGIDLELNISEFFFDLNLSNDIRKEVTTTFGSDYKPKWVKDISKVQDLSFYSNFYYYVPYSSNENTNTPTELDILPNLNVYGLVLESSHTYKEHEEFGRKFTRAIYDSSKYTTRLSVGDNSGPSTDFLSPIDYLGVSYGKDFSLRPYDITTPRGQAEFELSEPSTVKIFVNNSLIQIIRLQAGKHNLRDLPLIQGLNEIKLVIESDLGRIDEIIIPASFSEDLLKEGLSDFYYGAGQKSIVVDRDIDYLDDENIYTIFHRYGFTKDFTLGGYFQGDNDTQLYGSDQVYSTRFGEFKTQLTASAYDGEIGSNVKVDYYFYNRSDKGYAATGHEVGIEWQSPEFKLVGDPNPNGYKSSTLSYSFNSNYKRLNYRLGTEFDWNNQANDEWIVSAGISQSFYNSMSVNINYSFRQEVNASNSTEVGFFYNWYMPEDNHNVYANYESGSENAEITYQKLQDSSYDEFSYEATARTNPSESSAEVNLDYNHQRLETNLTHVQVKPNGDDWGNYNGRLKLGTAIGIVGGNISIGRPITEGFAIIERDKYTQDQDIKINKILDKYEFESDYFNNLMISKLQAYQYSQVRIDPMTLDDGLSLKKEEFSVFPTYKSGTLIRLESDGSISAYGKLMIGTKPVSLSTFEILDSKGKVIATSFTNRRGRILIEGLSNETYLIRVKSNNKIYEKEISINTKSFGLFDLKSISLNRVSK